MLGIAIRCIQHSQAMLERGVCELAHSFFHFFHMYSGKSKRLSYWFQVYTALLRMSGVGRP